MIQTHQQLKIISDEYNSLFSKNEFYPLQKAYTTPHFLVLSIRFPGKSIAIYIGRGNQYQGIFLADKLPPAFLRVQDRLLDYVRKYLVGTRLGKLTISDSSLVASFQFKNDQPNNSFIFGYKERQLFFCKQSKDESYLSWSGQIVDSNSLQSEVDKFNADKIDQSKNENSWKLSDYLTAEEKKANGQPVQKKKEKFLTRKISNISKDLESAQVWSLLQNDLIENRLNLNTDELKAHGQKIKLLRVTSEWLKRDLVFKKIKKLKKAEEILSARLIESENEFENVKKGEFDFEITKEKIIQPLWITHQKSLPAKSGDFNVKNFKLKNLNGVVGLDAGSNDWIRGNASKEHYWFHVENHTGAHCVIKTEDFTKLGFQDLEAIASMLRDLSKLEILEIPIVFTQVKNLKGIKGAKGSVTIKKPKHLSCVYRNWKEIITIFE